MIVDTFLDIIKHTSDLGFIKMVKLNGDESGIDVSAIDEYKAVVINGRINTPIDNLIGTVGLHRINILSGYLKFPEFASPDADVSIVTSSRNGETVPSEIKFLSNKGHESYYRFMSPEIANEMIKVPPFKGANFQVSVEDPPLRSLMDLKYISGILSSVESLFTVKTVDNNLVFNIGDGASDRTSMVFASNVDGVLSHAWSYPLQQVLSILKLYESSKKTVIQFSDQGALQIIITSDIGEYKYILPARSH